MCSKQFGVSYTGLVDFLCIVHWKFTFPHLPLYTDWPSCVKQNIQYVYVCVVGVRCSVQWSTKTVSIFSDVFKSCRLKWEGLQRYKVQLERISNSTRYKPRFGTYIIEIVGDKYIQWQTNNDSLHILFLFRLLVKYFILSAIASLSSDNIVIDVSIFSD